MSTNVERLEALTKLAGTQGPAVNNTDVMARLKEAISAAVEDVRAEIPAPRGSDDR